MKVLSATATSNNHFTSFFFSISVLEWYGIYLHQEHSCPSVPKNSYLNKIFLPFSFSSSFPKAKEIKSSANMSRQVFNLHRGTGSKQAACQQSSIANSVQRESLRTLVFKQGKANQCVSRRCPTFRGQQKQQNQLLGCRGSRTGRGPPLSPLAMAMAWAWM